MNLLRMHLAEINMDKVSVPEYINVIVNLNKPKSYETRKICVYLVRDFFKNRIG